VRTFEDEDQLRQFVLKNSIHTNIKYFSSSHLAQLTSLIAPPLFIAFGPAWQRL